MQQDPSDEILMHRYLEGQPYAFQMLLQRYGGRVYNFIVRRTGDRQQAEDLVQEVFLRIVRRADSFRGESKFSTWMYTIARNLCVDASRRSYHRRVVQLDQPAHRGEEDGPTLIDQSADPGPTPDRRAEDLRFRDDLQKALDSLPAEQREVFVMREFEGLRFREIAEVVGAPENTIKSRMRYALEGLRSRLSAYAEGDT